jgi:hypothetical protein
LGKLLFALDNLFPRSDAMQTFLTRHRDEIKGVLSGFDRIRFRGTLRWLATASGLESYLTTSRILLKEFKPWALGLTEQVKQATTQLATSLGRPIRFVTNSRFSKEDIAADIAQADRVTEGLVCVLTAVEPCRTFFLRRDRERRRIEIRSQSGKCLHQYFYLRHPELGQIHLRLQTWLPFTVFVCVNGREWLARQLIHKGIPFEQRDNCFVDVADVSCAQKLLSDQLRTDWTRLLDGLLKQVHPAHASLFGAQSLDYYWSAEQTEWATDILFGSRESLARLYPRLVRYAVTAFECGDVLRFLGRRPHVKLFRTSEIHSTLKTRSEGVRVKHELNANSVKMYDKQETVLRVETTINDPRDMKSYRRVEGDSKGPKRWRRLRKGVADLRRRAEVSQKCNERYVEALAAVDSPASLQDTLKPISQPKTWRGRRVRALQPFQLQDGRLFQAIGRGEFALNGFRNRDLRPLLYPKSNLSADDRRRQSAKISRQLRLLRAHGIIRKIPKTHRYQLSKRGSLIVAAVHAAQTASVERLTQLAV